MTSVARPDAAGKRRVDLIWNVTLVCPWDCAICCVDAVQVTKHGDRIHVRSHGLKVTSLLPFETGAGTAFEQAMRWRQEAGLELNLAGKLRVLDHLDGFAVRIDFSGGDPLVVRENYDVLGVASTRFGRDGVTLTATGRGLARYDVPAIAPLIGELNFTYDSPSTAGGATRPPGYAVGNLKRARTFADAGVRTRGECPLTLENVHDDVLERIYLDLHDAGIDKLLLMRLFPSGRGSTMTASTPSPAQYRRAIALLRDLERRYGQPRVHVQCALKFFENQEGSENPCDLVRESFGLMADGTLLASPWAIGPVGRPLHEAWVLGDLATTSLAEILASEKASFYQKRLDDNYGMCKIHAFMNSSRANPIERIFDTTDPLYATHLVKADQLTALEAS